MGCVLGFRSLDICLLYAGLFRVEDTSEIVWNDKCFEQLVLPYDYKELSLGFAESHIKKSNVFDDFVHGKGRGMVCEACVYPSSPSLSLTK